MELPEATIRLVLGMFLLIPLSYLIRFLPSRSLREKYSLLVGLAMQYWVFRESIVPVYAQHLMAYALIKWKGPKCGALVTYQSILFLSGYQIYLMVFSYGQYTMSAEALVMILVCKYSLFAYNIQDGALSPEKCSEEQLRYRITKQTNYLDFLGYLTFLPTCLIGPPLEFNDYDQFMALNGAFQKIDSVWPIVFVTLGETVLFAGLYAVEQMFFPVMAMADPGFYLNSGIYILWYTFLTVTLCRAKYYFGWKLSMAGVHASGVSWTEKGNFRRINTVNPRVTEESPHIREKINHWNIMVQEWLRKCIYQRSGIKNKTLSQLWTFLISAIWHGFYGAYYLSFFFWFLQLHFQGLLFKFNRNPNAPHVRLFHKLGALGPVLAWLLVSFFFNHNGVFFQILSFEACKLHLAKFHYLPQILLIAAVVVFSFIKPPKHHKEHPHPKHEEEKEKLVEQKSTPVTEASKQD